MKAFREILTDWKGERSLGEVAPLLGVSLSTVHYWIAGRYLPPRTRIPALASALGLSVEELAAIVADSKPVDAVV